MRSVIAGSRKAKRRVGRGIAAGQGKTAGRGTKGQKARAGGKIVLEIGVASGDDVGLGDGGRGKNRSAEVGVNDDAGGIDEGPEPGESVGRKTAGELREQGGVGSTVSAIGGGEAGDFAATVVKELPHRLQDHPAR